MNANQIENSFCEAVDIIVGEALSKLQFDKTIRAKIVTCVDPSIGKYKVKYQDSNFYAFSENIKTTYLDNQEVYVVIPSNDFSNPNKVIRGTVKKLGTDYIVSATMEDKMTKVGINIIQDSTGFGLNSYAGAQEIILYDKNEETNLLNVSQDDLRFYCKDQKHVLIGATFQTELAIEQQYSGNYGLMISVDYYDNIGQADEHIVTRHYILDVDKMSGNPYKYVVPTRQFGIFDVDGANMIEISSVKIFSKNFPFENKDVIEDDIWINKIEFQFMEPLTDEEIAGSSLRILTPFGALIRADETSKRIDAELKIQGLKVNYDTQDVKFYWFIEDASVDSFHSYYYKYGGQGWRCLNESKLISPEVVNENGEVTEPAIYYFKPATYQYVVQEPDCLTYETKFKCVALYGETAIDDTIVIYNKNSEYFIELVSENGTQFYYDNGVTNLTCNIYKGENKVLQDPSEFTYSWGMYNEFGAYTPLLDITENIYYNLYVNTITNLATYKCTVIKDNKVFGTSSIVIRNSLSTEGVYSLIINNGTQVFKYNANGTSPAAETNDTPFAIPTLSFDIYNNLGQILDQDVRDFIETRWTFPTELTMLTYDEYTTSGSVVNNGDGTSTLYNSAEFIYGIANKYNINNMQNDIKLEVLYKDIILTQTTNFTFTKEGELGTNGTDYTCRIVPIRDTIEKVWIQYIYTGDSPTETTHGYFNTNASTYQNVKALRAQLWADNEVVFDSEGSYTGASVEWSLLNKATDNDTVVVNKDTGAMTIRNWDQNHTVNIVKATIKYNGQTFYATYPLLVYCYPVDYQLRLSGGYEYCIYASDGTRYQYNQAKPFSLSLLYNNKEVISSVDTINWYSSDNIKLVAYKDEDKNVVKYKTKATPPDKYDGLDIDNYISSIFAYNDKTFYVISPIHLFLNRYGLAALNGWDGNSIEIDNKDNYILTPQIGAGVKNDDNTFTGLVMGKVQSSNSANADIGLLGYDSGERTIFLDAETGKAEFGKSGKAKVIIDPSSDKAQIYSGNYSTTKKTGLMIDLTTPYIKFGSGNFEVNSSGHITAKGGGSIGGWNISDTTLKSGNITLDSGKNELNINNKFIVHNDGSFSASNSKFTVESDGTINATGGKIGNWNINSTTLHSGGTTLDSNGTITCSNLIAQSSGNIGGWIISPSTLTAGNTTLNSNGTITCSQLIATNAGTIGNWTIGSTGLTGGFFSVDGLNFGGGFGLLGGGITLTNGGFNMTPGQTTVGGTSLPVYIKDLTVDTLRASTITANQITAGTVNGYGVSWTTAVVVDDLNFTTDTLGVMLANGSSYTLNYVSSISSSQVTLFFLGVKA